MEFLDEGRVSLKKRKEEFVSNLHGSTMLEIATLSAVVPSFILLRQVCGLLLSASKADYVDSGSDHPVLKDKSRDGKRYVIMLVKDVVFVGVPTLFCLTVLADWVYVVTAVSFCLTIAGIASLLRWGCLEAFCILLPSLRNKDLHSPSCLLRLNWPAKMLVTCVSILAVDFNIFPRRYAKTETYGTGLMDVGVGSFIVANGLVSRQARNMPPSKYGGVLRNTSPLLIIGFCRLILTKGVDYQEHVAEYGVHWNFFFSLAAVALLTSLIHIPASHCGILGGIILGVYQAVLSSGLNTYLLSPERGPGLISLNKEGVYSIFGYWSMYLISVQLGHYLLFLPKGFFYKQDDISTKGKGNNRRAAPWWVALDVWLLDAIFWLLAHFSDKFIERISRRMCNLAYVLFVFAMNLEVIAIFLTVDLILPFKPMRLLQIFDRNLLATFLWGNILTGLVNVTVETITASSAMALITLLGYLATLVGGMATVDFFGLKLKFW